MKGTKVGTSIPRAVIASATLLILIPSMCAMVSTQRNELEVTKTADPTAIHLAGSGLDPDATTIEISVTGYGGTIEETLPIDVVFAIDSSGSMKDHDPDNLRLEAAKYFVDRLDPTRDQAGLVSWNADVEFTYPDPRGLTNDFSTLKTKIDEVDSEGGTILNPALYEAIYMLREGARTEPSVEAIIFLSNGEGHYTMSGDGGPAAFAAREGYVIYSIGLDVSPGTQGEANLMDMAAATGGEYYSSTADMLEEIFHDILQTIIVSTAPSSVDVVEVTQSYMVGEGGFSVPPDSVVEDEGKTEITWLNVAQHVGNGDDRLAADEKFAVTFSVGSSQAGEMLPVSVEGKAVVNYLDPEGGPQTVDIPQAHIDVVTAMAKVVSIDIKPGSYPNAINPKSRGVIPVAVLTTEDFDASTIDHSTVRFGPDGAKPVHRNRCGHMRDVDRDGDLDAVYHFKTRATGIQKGDTEATLTGYTADGIAIEGTDSIKTVAKLRPPPPPPKPRPPCPPPKPRPPCAPRWRRTCAKRRGC